MLAGSRLVGRVRIFPWHLLKLKVLVTVQELLKQPVGVNVPLIHEGRLPVSLRPVDVTYIWFYSMLSSQAIGYYLICQ